MWESNVYQDIYLQQQNKIILHDVFIIYPISYYHSI
jgi:hypothetical protein